MSSIGQGNINNPEFRNAMDIQKLFDLVAKNAENQAGLHTTVLIIAKTLETHTADKTAHSIPPCDPFKAHLADHEKRGERGWGVFMAVFSAALPGIVALVIWLWNLKGG